MSGRGDDDDRGERPKRSWSELDRLRDKPRSRTPERRPHGAAAEARARGATKAYLAKLDGQLFGMGAKRSGPAAKHADAVLAALGTPALTDACRAQLAEVGPPRDAAGIGAFLDARDREVQLAALAALAEEVAAGRLTPTPGLRSQLRVLAEGLDDALAEAAEAILAIR